MLSDRIAQLITPAIEAMGFELVRVHISGNRRPTLQVMAEPKDGSHMSVDDCAELSRAISAILDVEDPISGAYSLEVSSPGIDRPLVRWQDFQRFLGYEAKIETKEPIEGRRRFKGPIGGASETVVTIACDGQEVSIPIACIHKAKLVLTDALIAAHLADRAEPANPIQDQAQA